MLKYLVVLFTLFTALPAQAGIIVYENNFESGSAGSAITGVRNIVSSQGYSAVGFGSRFLHNATGSSGAPVATTITLTNLPEHDSVNIGFLLALIDSWDGNNSTFGPDRLQIRLDGSLILNEIFPTSSVISPFRTSSANYGFNGSFPDRAYNFNAFPSFTNTAHSSPNLTLSFVAAGSGYQGGTDESYAIDNISISVNPLITVPEPGTFGVLGLGLIGLFRRRMFS